MTTRYKTRAFIFKKIDRNESDRIFSVFTEDFGRLDIFAKAIRKSVSKLRSGIDSFFISEIEFIQGRNRKTLTDATVIKKLSDIYNNLEKIKIANKMGEILDNFIKGEEKDKEIFNLVSETFINLDNYKLSTINHQLIYYYFLWNMLSLLGYHLEVQKCNTCQSNLNPNDIHFSYKFGGVICGNCVVKEKGSCLRINSDIVKILRLILKKDWQMLSKLKINLYSQNLLENISTKAIQNFCPL